ncbi:MAG: hypothetical protein HYZ85_04785 [Candidatus Omnitrophica bacterium]|nr:hypothetical protein [Candidatus Omnitrophota bacterium]
MLNIKQRDTLEKVSVNLLTIFFSSLVISNFVTGSFKLAPFIIGLFWSFILLYFALWINRKGG